MASATRTAPLLKSYAMPVDATAFAGVPSVTALGLLPKARVFLAAAMDRRVVACDLAAEVPKGTPGARLPAKHLAWSHAHWIHALDVHPDGERVATGGVDKCIKLWKWGAHQPLASVRAHADAVRAVAFAPDGRWLASAGDDGKVKLWEATTGRPVATLDAGRSFLDTLAWAGGGKQFLDGKVVAEPASPPSKEPAVVANTAPPRPPFSRREALARVVLDPRSPYLKRALVNRVWRRLMGRGLVEPVDMMNEGNPATHPQLLDLLADDFACHGFDLRRLIAVIMQSQAYARAGRWPGNGKLPPETLYAVAVLKPLDADQMALSLPLATGYYDAQLNGSLKQTMARVRPLTPWPELVAEFDTEGDEFEPSASQALFLTNSPYVQKHFQDESRLARELTSVADDTGVARKAYLAILSRLPLAEETKRVRRYLKARGAGACAEACRELVWALLGSAEFRFNH